MTGPRVRAATLNPVYSEGAIGGIQIFLHGRLPEDVDLGDGLEIGNDDVGILITHETYNKHASFCIIGSGSKAKFSEHLAGLLPGDIVRVLLNVWAVPDFDVKVQVQRRTRLYAVDRLVRTVRRRCAKQAEAA